MARKNNYEGKIVYLADEEKGYGFIEVEGLEKSVFFHAKDLRHISFSKVRKGDSVEIEDIEKTEKGYNAKYVYLIS